MKNSQHGRSGKHLLTLPVLISSPLCFWFLPPLPLSLSLSGTLSLFFSSLCLSSVHNVPDLLFCLIHLQQASPSCRKNNEQVCSNIVLVQVLIKKKTKKKQVGSHTRMKCWADWRGGEQQGVNIRVSQVVYLGWDCAKHEKKKTPASNFRASNWPFITFLSAEEVSRRGGGGEG